MLGIIKRYASDSRGSAALISILAAIPVVAAAGLAIDYSRTVRATSELQDVADAAALAAAAGKNITGTTSQKQAARQTIANKYITDSLPKVSDVEIIGTPTVTVGPNTVDVAINGRVKGSLLNVLNALPDDAEIDPNGEGGGDAGKDFEFTVHTKAGFSKDSYLCLLSLSDHEQEAVYFQGNSEFMASTCTVQANSDHTTAMRTWGNAYAEAEDFCSVGGWVGSGFEPDPSTGCTTRTDPYASLVLPTAGACITAGEIPAADVKPAGVTVKNTTASLVPGTYCGGLSIQNATTVANMAPGLYIIKNGDLSVTANATLNAPSGVVIYLTGNSKINITSGTTVTLKGPTATTADSSTAPYKGFALMQDRTTGVGNVNTISSGGAVNITGAAYMPKQNLTIWANGDMNAASPYFPMIVDTLDMSGTATLHVNLDWSLAGFPEPVELKKKAKVLLTQ